MTVQELIDELEKVEHKQARVELSVDNEGGDTLFCSEDFEISTSHCEGIDEDYIELIAVEKE